MTLKNDSISFWISVRRLEECKVHPGWWQTRLGIKDVRIKVGFSDWAYLIDRMNGTAAVSLCHNPIKEYGEMIQIELEDIGSLIDERALELFIKALI
jgi:hypothetical protein